MKRLWMYFFLALGVGLVLGMGIFLAGANRAGRWKSERPIATAVSAEAGGVGDMASAPPRSMDAVTETAQGRGGNKLEKATFSAGCFWGVEETFRKLEGVTSTTVGYTGGSTENPTYEQVCSGHTGHAESVEVIYDPAKISYDRLLDVFWSNHNPTTPNRQGPDVGTQYRSAIFYHSPEQQAAAVASRDRLQASGKFRSPIVTQILPAGPFYRAEEYHQRYLEKQGRGSCHI